MEIWVILMWLLLSCSACCGSTMHLCPICEPHHFSVDFPAFIYSHLVDLCPLVFGGFCAWLELGVVTGESFT